jgi:nitrous oxidase accessory protein NosD
MNLLVLLITAFLLFAVAITPVSAGPSPSDGGEGPAANAADVLQTALFGLFEVDLSALGVSATELLTVGPQAELTAASGTGMLIVDDDQLDCPNAQFMTIQSAVTAAMPGDKIKVCRGTYMEQVTIPVGKDGLTLFAAAAFQAVIKAPPIMMLPKAIVHVNGAHDVTIRHFTITGPGGTGCDSIRYGVRVDNDGSALITDNHITEIHDTPFSGCQNGHGVNVGRMLLDGPTSGSAVVVHNLIDKYQKGGIFVDNIGSRADVAHNEVVGVGPTLVIAQNGIQVSRGAHGEVHHNKVSQNIYAPPGTVATGILLFMDPVAYVHHNDVFLNEDGIGLLQVNATADVSYNNARNNTNDGIVVFDNATRDNLISHNKAFENAVLDCHDESIGTHNSPANVANEWLKDLGRTENRPGLCKNAGPK